MHRVHHTCTVQDYRMSLENQWSSCTVPSVVMCTLPNLQGTTILMVSTLALVSHTCSSWYILNFDLQSRPTSLFQGMMMFGERVALILYHGHISDCRLYGFKIHPMAYQLQQQAATKSRSAGSRPRSQKQPYK